MQGGLPVKKLISLCVALVMLVSASMALAEETSPLAQITSDASGRLAQILADGKIVVATSPDYAPYEFLDTDGNPVGADMAFAQYIADQLGVELEIQSMDFDTVLAAISTGKVDLAIAGMVPKDERKEVMDFSDVYYNDGNQIILIRKDAAETYKTLADFAGVKVAAQNGTLQQELVTEQLPDATIEPIAKIPDAVMMLMSGKVEGVALASVVADQYIANYPDLMICESPFAYESLGTAVAVVKGETSLLDAVNAVVADVVESGVYYQWIDEAVQLNNSMNQ
jgi:polar amino acid transport system substrate-binding protein